MQLVQWNPFREMDELLSRFQTGLSRLPARRGDSLSPAEFAPAVDISETPDAYLLKAELPGLNKDEVKVKLHNGILTLTGERKSEQERKDEKFHRVERSFGSFTRSFALPEDAVAERISAECKDGVLTVRVGRSEAPKAEAVEIPIA